MLLLILKFSNLKTMTAVKEMLEGVMYDDKSFLSLALGFSLKYERQTALQAVSA